MLRFKLRNGEELFDHCGVSATKVCVASCGSATTGTCIATNRFKSSAHHIFVEDNAVCKEASNGVIGRCYGGECLLSLVAVKCGNGIV